MGFYTQVAAENDKILAAYHEALPEDIDVTAAFELPHSPLRNIAMRRALDIGYGTDDIVHVNQAHVVTTVHPTRRQADAAAKSLKPLHKLDGRWHTNLNRLPDGRWSHTVWRACPAHTEDGPCVRDFAHDGQCEAITQPQPA